MSYIEEVRHAKVLPENTSRDSARFRDAIERIDAANREDPNQESEDSQQHPKEMLYARRMTACLERIAPDASEAVRLAARAQHIRRWEIPRGQYPRDRQGYRRWRTDLGRFHAETAGEILTAAGYDADTIARVQSLLRKARIKTDPDCQLLEDVICLVFLEHYFAAFAEQHDEVKLVRILQRTWKKMSPRGRRAALDLELPEALRALVEKAVAAQGAGDLAAG